MNAEDRLTGGSEHDVLSLTGSGSFDLSKLAAFSGFEEVRLTNATSSSASLVLRDGVDLKVVLGNGSASSYSYPSTGSISVSLGTGHTDLQGGNESDYIYVRAPSSLKSGDQIDGGDGINYLRLQGESKVVSGGYDPTTGTWAEQVYGNVEYDLTNVSIKNIYYLYVETFTYGSAMTTIKVDSASLSGIRNIYGPDYRSSALVTDAATLDLGGVSVTGTLIESFNTSGTVFTTSNIQTAMQIVGGTGQDKVVVIGATLTEAQRDQIFSGSVETIQDSSGTYANNLTFKAPALSAPILSGTGNGSPTLPGTAPVGSFVSLYDGSTLIETVQADIRGRCLFNLSLLPAGDHQLTAVAATSDQERASPPSSPLSVFSGTGAEIVAKLADFAARSVLPALLITEGSDLPFATKAALDAARASYGAVLGKIAGTYTLSVVTTDASGETSTVYGPDGILQKVVFEGTDGSLKTDRYAPDGTKLSQTYIHDGVREEHNYVVTGKPYARQDAVYDAKDKLISMERTYADGKPALNQVVRPDGSQAVTQWTSDGTKTSLAFDTAGRLTTIETETAQGVRTLSETRAADGSKEVHHFSGVTGKEISSLIVHADKSQVKTQYVANKPYADQTLVFDAKGKLVSVERHYGDGTLNLSTQYKADGTAEVHGYDTAGRETVRIVGNLSGERDTFEYSYAGTSKTPATTTQTHYGTGNVKLWSDQTAADGSHSQVAKAAGAVLVSHAGVADTFTGFKGGADTFVFGQGFGKDVVKGFEAGSGMGHDVLTLDDRLASSFAELQSHMTKLGGDTLIAFGADTIVLKGVAPTALTADNVHFVHHDLLLA
ncbi:hypothetical protein GCM10011390_20900 [Aureimonas endophytica]|uniref:YD repeat-containing protein n=1 Tax=Aureimonas endophytica TaxID=2027858 RepID=A0A917E4B2_9HYPH|nr:hypothetical protein GCM10011390_20900 [Aureimonas endophytica]